MIAENTDINNILKSTINNLIQENKRLLESNEQLKKEDSKLRNYIINIVARELETQIQLISGWSKLLLEHYKSPQQFPDIPMIREDIIRLTQLTHNAALKLHHQVEDMKGNVKKN
jgi:predicted glycoside hydrolase/deacetylase ChbG (UPF0249 family)